MINIKNLAGGGDKDVESILESAAILGIDVIELMWLPKNGQPRHDVAEVNGFKLPKVGKALGIEDTIRADYWYDGTVKFYPDPNGRCWGYVYDVPENRKLLYSSFRSGWFKIVNNELREKIKKEAEENGFNTERAVRTEVNIKKTAREREAEKVISTKEKRIDELMQQMADLKRDLEMAKNVKQVSVADRLAGTPIPDPEVTLANEVKQEAKRPVMNKR